MVLQYCVYLNQGASSGVEQDVPTPSYHITIMGCMVAFFNGGIDLTVF